MTLQRLRPAEPGVGSIAAPPPDRAMLGRHLALIGAAILVWVWSLLRADESMLGNYGLLTILPLTGYLALTAMLAGYLHAVRIDRSGRLLGTYVVGLTLMLHGAAPLAYDHLRYSWAWKHVGIVEYIQRTGSVDRDIAELTAYHNWPAFFGVSAGINGASGVDSALAYAAWAPLLWNILFIGVLYVMFQAFTSDHRLLWTAILLFGIGNWVGQDYFAPQAVAYVLYLLVLAIVLRWYARTPLGPGNTEAQPRATVEPGSTESLALSAVLFLVLLAISATHQLTPIMTILALGGLTVFRVIRVRWPFVVISLFTAAWLIGPARPFVLDSLGGVTREVGGIQNNLGATLVARELFDRSQFIISQTARALSGVMVFLAGLGLLQRTRHRLPVRWSIVLASIPALLVFVSSYGGEVVFRAYMFALPIIAFLAASIWFPTQGAAHETTGRTGLAVVVFALSGALLVASYGADSRQVFSDDEIAAADYMYSHAEPGALVIEGTRDYPRQYRNYEQLHYVALDRSTQQTLDLLESDPASLLASWLHDDATYNGGFVILTESQRRTISALGPALPAMLDRVESSLRNSEAFDIAFESGDVVVFTLAEEP